MKYRPIFYFFFVQIWPTFLFCSGSLETKRRFVVISDSSVANQFYHKIRNTKPNFHNEPNIDVSTKRQICMNITSGLLYWKYRKSEKKVITSLRLIENFNCPNKSIRIRVRNESSTEYASAPRSDEMAFACLIRPRCHIKTFYISEEYNLYALNGPSREYAPGRFIFKRRNKGHRKSYVLHGLAESAGNAFSSVDHDIERLYLHRRKRYSISWQLEEDALCSLSIAERRRICVAVFSSNYFEGRVVLSNNNWVSCRLSKVSFQTEYGQKKAKKQFYRTERMMDCDDLESKNRMAKKSDYLISHAYESNQIFVFFRNNNTGEIFLENLTTDVRLTFVPPNSTDPMISNNTSEDHSGELRYLETFPSPFTFGALST